MKILIIEDEKMVADSLKSLLEQKGFQVECVYDGEAGEDYALLGVYDLLILDVMVPKLDGYEVAQRVRAQRCGTPILMLTARASLEDRIRGLEAGADYYLTKPFDSRELLACIHALLRRQGAQVNELVIGPGQLLPGLRGPLRAPVRPGVRRNAPPLPGQRQRGGQGPAAGKGVGL